MSFTSQWKRIVGLETQPILRNLLITQGYHELSRAFARMLGPENVTWFSFASWSSKTVGGFLQSAPIEARLTGRTSSFPPPPTDPPPRPPTANQARFAQVFSAVHEARRFLAKGNTEVFGELAPIFTSFLEVFESDDAPDEGKLEQFLRSLEDGASAPDHVSADPQTRELALLGRGGQGPLREAVRHYYHAKFEPDPKRKAERILLANAHIGVHEQTRLQTYIRGALDAPLRTFVSSTAQRVIGRQIPVSSHAHGMFRRIATERWLTLKLPDSRVRLGRDLRAAPGQPLFPRILERIEHPELGSIFAKYSLKPSDRPRPRAALGTAADDWSSLDQRMRFILELFRSRQQNQRLLEPTFSDAQVSSLRVGQMPVGPLA